MDLALLPKLASQFDKHQKNVLFVGFIDLLILFLTIIVAFVFVVPFYISWMTSTELLDKYASLFARSDYDFYRICFSAVIGLLGIVWLAELLSILRLWFGIYMRKPQELQPYRRVLKVRILFQLSCAIMCFLTLVCARLKRAMLVLAIRITAIVFVMVAEVSDDVPPNSLVDTINADVKGFGTFLSIASLCVGAFCAFCVLQNSTTYGTVTKCAKKMEEKNNGFKEIV